LVGGEQGRECAEREGEFVLASREHAHEKMRAALYALRGVLHARIRSVPRNARLRGKGEPLFAVGLVGGSVVARRCRRFALPTVARRHQTGCTEIINPRDQKTRTRHRGRKDREEGRGQSAG